MSTCPMPDCHQPCTTKNRAGQWVCLDHEMVVVGGSWVKDKHDATSGGEH